MIYNNISNFQSRSNAHLLGYFAGWLKDMFGCCDCSAKFISITSRSELVEFLKTLKDICIVLAYIRNQGIDLPTGCLFPELNFLEIETNVKISSLDEVLNIYELDEKTKEIAENQEKMGVFMHDFYYCNPKNIFRSEKISYIDDKNFTVSDKAMKKVYEMIQSEHMLYCKWGMDILSEVIHTKKREELEKRNALNIAMEVLKKNPECSSKILTFLRDYAENLNAAEVANNLFSDIQFLRKIIEENRDIEELTILLKSLVDNNVGEYVINSNILGYLFEKFKDVPKSVHTSAYELIKSLIDNGYIEELKKYEIIEILKRALECATDNIDYKYKLLVSIEGSIGGAEGKNSGISVSSSGELYTVSSSGGRSSGTFSGYGGVSPTNIGRTSRSSGRTSIPSNPALSQSGGIKDMRELVDRDDSEIEKVLKTVLNDIGTEEFIEKGGIVLIEWKISKMNCGYKNQNMLYLILDILRSMIKDEKVAKKVAESKIPEYILKFLKCREGFISEAVIAFIEELSSRSGDYSIVRDAVSRIKPLLNSHQRIMAFSSLLDISRYYPDILVEEGIIEILLNNLDNDYANAFTLYFLYSLASKSHKAIAKMIELGTLEKIKRLHQNMRTNYSSRMYIGYEEEVITFNNKDIVKKLIQLLEDEVK